MLLLLPDLHGGFSFYQMAERFPADPVWTTLGRLFTHVQWSGFTVWDLIQPSFIFLVGVAMPLSASARQARGDTPAQIFSHVVLRSAALLLLGLILGISFRRVIDELWPLMLICSSVSLPTRAATALGLHSQLARRRVELAISTVVVAATVAWIALNLDEVGNYTFNAIFGQLALTIPFAFLLVGKGWRVQSAAVVGILVAYWSLYAFYPLPGPTFDRAVVGVEPSDEWYGGFFAHWNKNANAGSAFDAWFLNLLPRAQAFEFDKAGLTMLNFVPSIATMTFGVLCGELLSSRRPRGEIRNALLGIAAAGLGTGLVATALCPLVKSLWTPSWTLFTAGLTTVVLALLYELCDVRRIRAWTAPLSIFGTNAILLYVLSSNYRWWFLALPKKLLGLDIGVGAHGPLLESLVFAAMLGALAFALHRLKIFVRL
jgi:predicted acyltransferase